MLTIHSLEVTFDVDAASDEAVFARLFARHIGEWAREHADDRQRRRSLEQLSALGDRDTPETDA